LPFPKKKKGKTKRSSNPLLDGNFMDYIGLNDDFYGDNNHQDNTGLGNAARLTTQPNDLFGIYGEPEQSFNALSESFNPTPTDIQRLKQKKNYKQFRRDVVKTGGQTNERERMNGSDEASDRTYLYKKSRSGGLGLF
jgi:hypothetical protein